MPCFLCTIVSICALSLSVVPSAAQGLGLGSTERLVIEWPVASPDTMGLDTEALEAHRALCERTGADGCLIAYRGYVVSEWYGPKYREPMHTMSSMKSWAGILTGMLIADGKISSVHDPVSQYIPEWQAGSEAGITIHHLLTMTGGLERRTGREGPMRSIGFEPDKNGFVLELPVDFEPGTRWAYSNEGAQLLSPILERAAGVPLQDYARQRLFEPLGMQDTELMVDEYGHAWTYADAKTTLRDFARIAQLMLNNGRWNGQEVVPEWWVRVSTQAHASPNQHTGYGYLWWTMEDPHRFASMGFRATDSYVFPDLELVIVRMQNSVSPEPPETPYYRASGDIYRQIVPAQ